MPFHAYIIRSKSSGRLYKGHTENLKQRLHQHNLGKTKSTKAGVPWKLIYEESFDSRKDAIEREKYFKTATGRKWIKKNIAFD